MGVPLSKNLAWTLANPIWAASLNPIIANPILSGNTLNNVVLQVGANTISHGLGRNMQGWFITDINGAATIYRRDSFNSSTLTLTSSAIVTVNLWVY